MEIHHLRAFCEVARERSFTQAAKNLHCAQSTITGHIKSLEKSLGIVLFRRRGRCPIELTDVGLLLQARAEQILHAIELTNQEIRRAVLAESAVRHSPYSHTRPGARTLARV
ncbi:LysR family transcriptional regulator [Streptomyces sp. ZAF1911]|uniref:LysR family transcriptional regulator n=1 Tax=unclassified Streptomyces TaxID=2593676 RepID=UPI00237A6A54|nr:LysR family transcriptional regulator [Streptomyces sp. ZAF1911]MDD9382977.1 LysR family transcriptional regulator [Streptomyces sp. ZAF1911]